MAQAAPGARPWRCAPSSTTPVVIAAATRTVAPQPTPRISWSSMPDQDSTHGSWYARSVRVPSSPRFDEERERFQLRFTCEDCAHFDRERVACRHFWPNETHQLSYYKTPVVIDFCKEFELW